MDSISLFSQNSAKLMSPRTQTRNFSGPSSPKLKRTFSLFKTARFPSDVVEIPKKKKTKSQADTRSYDSFSNLSFSSLNFYTEPNEDTNSSILFSNLEDSAQNVKNEYLAVLSTVSDTLNQNNSKEIKKNDSNILKNLLTFSSPKHQKNNFFLDKIMDSDSESLPNPIPKKYVDVDIDNETYFSEPAFYRRLYEKRKRNYSKSNKISKITFDSDEINDDVDLRSNNEEFCEQLNLLQNENKELSTTKERDIINDLTDDENENFDINNNNEVINNSQTFDFNENKISNEEEKLRFEEIENGNNDNINENTNNNLLIFEEEEDIFNNENIYKEEEENFYNDNIFKEEEEICNSENILKEEEFFNNENILKEEGNFQYENIFKEEDIFNNENIVEEEEEIFFNKENNAFEEDKRINVNQKEKLFNVQQKIGLIEKDFFSDPSFDSKVKNKNKTDSNEKEENQLYKISSWPKIVPLIDYFQFKEKIISLTDVNNHHCNSDGNKDNINNNSHENNNDNQLINNNDNDSINNENENDNFNLDENQNNDNNQNNQELNNSNLNETEFIFPLYPVFKCPPLFERTIRNTIKITATAKNFPKSKSKFKGFNMLKKSPYFEDYNGVLSFVKTEHPEFSDEPPFKDFSIKDIKKTIGWPNKNEKVKNRNILLDDEFKSPPKKIDKNNLSSDYNEVDDFYDFHSFNDNENILTNHEKKNDMEFRSNSVLSSDLLLLNFKEIEEEEEEVDNHIFRSASVLSSDLFLSDFEASDLSLSSDEEEIIFDVNIPNKTSFSNVNNEKIDSSEMKSTVNQELFFDKNNSQECFDILKVIQPNSFISTDKDRKYKDKFLVFNNQEKENFLFLKNNEFKINQQSEVYFSKKIIFPSIFIIPFLNYKEQILIDFFNYHQFKFIDKNNKDSFTLQKIDSIGESDTTFLSVFPCSGPIFSISKDNFNVCIETNKDKDSISTDSSMYNNIKYRSTSSDSFMMKIDDQKDFYNSDTYMFKKDEYKSILLEDLIFIDEYEFLNLECCDKDENHLLEDDFVPAHSLKKIADEDPFTINKQFIEFPKPNQFTSLTKKELNNYLIKNDKYIHIVFPKGNKYYNLGSLFDVSNPLNYSSFDKLFDNNKIQSGNYLLFSNETFSVLREDDKAKYLLKKSDNFVDEIPFQNKYNDLFQNVNQQSSFALKTKPNSFIQFIFGSPFLDQKHIFISKEIDNQSIKCNYSPLDHEKMLSNITDAKNKRIMHFSSLDKFSCYENKKEKQFFIEDPNDSFVQPEKDFEINQISAINKTQDMISKESLNFPSSSSFISSKDKYSNKNNAFISSQTKYNQLTKTEKDFHTNEIKDEITKAENHISNINDALIRQDKKLYNIQIVIQNPFSNKFVSNDSIKYKNRNNFFISIQSKTNRKSHIYNEFQNEIFDTNKYLALTKPEVIVNDCLIHQKENLFNSNAFLKNPTSSSTFISNDLIQYQNKNNKFISTEAKNNDYISIIVKRFNEFTNNEADIKISFSSIKLKSMIHDKHRYFDKNTFDVNITLINISSSSFVSNDMVNYQNKSNIFISNQIKNDEYKPTKREFDEFQNKETEINKSLPFNVYKTSVLDSTNKLDSFKLNEILTFPSFSSFVSYTSKDYKNNTISFNSIENTDKQFIKIDKRFNEFNNIKTKKCLRQTSFKNEMKSNLVIRDKNIFCTNEIINNHKSSSFMRNDFQNNNKSETIKETVFNSNNSIKYMNKNNLFITEQDKNSNQPTTIEKGLNEFGNDEFEVNKTILIPNYITYVFDLSIKQNDLNLMNNNNSINYKNKENFFISTQSQKNQKEKNSYHSQLTNKSIPFIQKKNEVKDISIHQNTKKSNQKQNFKVSTSSSFISNESINYINGANSFNSIQSENEKQYYIKNNQKNVILRNRCNQLPQHKSKINDEFIKQENKLNKIDNLKTQTLSSYASNNLNDYSNKNNSFNSIQSQFNNNQVSLSPHKLKTNNELIKQENKLNKIDNFKTQTSSSYISNESKDYSNKNNLFISVQNQLNNNQIPLLKHKSKTNDALIKQENKLNEIDNLKTKTTSQYFSNESDDYSNKNNSFISAPNQLNNNQIPLLKHRSKTNDEFVKQENKLNKIDNLKPPTSSSYISNDLNDYSNKNTSFISIQHKNNKKEKSLSQFNNNQMHLKSTNKSVPSSHNISKINDEHIIQENKINTIENFKTQSSSSYVSNRSIDYSNKNNSFITVQNQLNYNQISSPQHKLKVNDEYINHDNKINTIENFKTQTSSPYTSNDLSDYSNKNTSFISIRPYYNKEEQNLSHFNSKQMNLPITNKSIKQEVKFNRTDVFYSQSSSSFNDSINCKNNLDSFISNQTNCNQKMDSFDNAIVPLSKNTTEIKDRSIQQKDNKSISMEYFITPTPFIISFNSVKYHNGTNAFNSIQSSNISKVNDLHGLTSHIKNRSIKPEIEDEMINQKENKYNTIEILQMPFSTFISNNSFKYKNQASSFILAHSHNNLVLNEFQNAKFDNIKSISTTNYSTSIHDFFKNKDIQYLSENISFNSKKENKSFLSINEFEEDNSKYSFDYKNESAKSPLLNSKIQSRSFKQKENEKKAIKNHSNITSSNLTFQTKQDSYLSTQNEFKTNETERNSNLLNSEFNINKNSFCVLESFNSFLSTEIHTTSYKIKFEDESFKPNVIKIKSVISPSTFPDFFNPTQNHARSLLISDLAVESEFDNYNIFNNIFKEYEEEEEDVYDFIPIDYSSMSLFRSDSEEEDEKESSEEIIRFGPINVIKKEIININDVIPKPKSNQSTQTNKENLQSLKSENSTKKSKNSSQSKRVRRRRPKKKQQQKDTNKIKSKQNNKKQQKEVQKHHQKEDESIKSKQKESEKIKKKQTEIESKPIKHHRRHNTDSISSKNDHHRNESESKSSKQHVHQDVDSISNKHHRRHETDSISGSNHHHKQRSNSRSSQKQKEVVTFPTSILKNTNDRYKSSAKEENSKKQNIQPKHIPQLKIVDFEKQSNIQKANEHHVKIHEAADNSEEIQIKKFITNPSDKKLNNEMNVKFAFSEVLNDDSKPFIIHKKDSISYKMFYRSLALPLVPTENENFSLLIEKVSEPLRLNRQFETLLEFLENYLKEKDTSWVDLYPLNTSNIMDRYPLIYGELTITKFNGEKKKEIVKNCKLLVDGTFLFDYPNSLKSSGNKKSKKSEESESKEQKDFHCAIKNCSIKETKNKKCLLVKSNDNNNSNFLNQSYNDFSIEKEGIQFINEIEIKSNNKELISQWLSLNNKLREKRSIIEYYISLLAFYSFYDLNSYRFDRTNKYEDGSSVNWTECKISDEIIEKSVLSPNLYLPLFVLNHPNNTSKIVNCLFNLFVNNNRHDFLIRTLILGEISTTPSKLIFQIPTVYNRPLLVLFTSPSIEWINSFADKIENVSVSPSIFLKMLLKEMNQMKQESVYIIRSILFLSFLVFGDSGSSFKVFILFLKSAILNVINNKKTEKTIQSFFAQIQIQVVDPKTKVYQRLFNFSQSLLLKKPILSKEYTFNDNIIGEYKINISQICKSILVFIQENEDDFIEFMEKKIINLNEEKKNLNEIHPLFFSFYQNVRFYLIKPYKDQVPIHS